MCIVRKILAFGGVALGTAVVGIAFGVLGAIVGSAILAEDYAGWGILVGAVMGGAIGYPVGVFIGLVIINKLIRYSGSLLLSFIGVAIGGVIPFLAEHLGTNIGSGLLLILPPVLGAIGYHLKDRPWRRRADSNR